MRPTREWEQSFMAVKPIPDGYHAVTPYLIVNDAAGAIDFYTKALGASELFRMPDPNGKVMHAELKVGGSVVMLADSCPEMGYRDALALGGTPVSLLIYVENVDEQFGKAVAAGGTTVKPLQNQFYGDRSGTIKDPYGHVWTIAWNVDDVAPEEINRRMQEMMKQQQPAA